MKRILNNICFLLLSIVIISISSCKKSSTATKATCRLKSFIHEKAGVKDTTLYSYNNDGKIIAAAMGTSSVIYTYSGHTVNRVYTNPPNPPFRDSIIIGSNGLITELYNFAPDGTVSRKQVITFNSVNTITQLTETTYPGPILKIYTLTYANGDLVGETDGGAVNATFEYYDKPSAIGDYWYLTQFLSYGSIYIVNKHLVKTSTNGSTVNNFAYEFDANGNVSKMTITESSNIDIYYLSYFCD